MRSTKPRTRSGVSVWESARAVGERVADATLNEITKLRLHTTGLPRVARQVIDLGPDVVAQASFDRMGCIKLEHGLHLVDVSASMSVMPAAARSTIVSMKASRAIPSSTVPPSGQI